jgi:hypothetical protein
MIGMGKISKAQFQKNPGPQTLNPKGVIDLN